MALSNWNRKRQTTPAPLPAAQPGEQAPNPARPSETARPTAAPEASRPAARPDADEIAAFIDEGSEFAGKLHFKENVQIDGRIDGELTAEKLLVVGETGEISAHIHAESVHVAGDVHGNIEAAGSIVLLKTARVRGDLRSASLAMEEGATLDGAVAMRKPGS